MMTSESLARLAKANYGLGGFCEVVAKHPASIAGLSATMPRIDPNVPRVLSAEFERAELVASIGPYRSALR